MKDLNNIVVEKPNSQKEFKEIMEAFKQLGHYNEVLASGDINWYFGIIGNSFNGYARSWVHTNNAKIITLEQLKAMKEDKSEYPKLMRVWNMIEQIAKKKEVFFKDNDGGYWTYDDDFKNTASLYRFAKDIEPEKPELKKEIINITLPHDVETIITINGREVEFKKQDQ